MHRKVPQNPKAERHLRPRKGRESIWCDWRSSPEPKSRKAFETPRSPLDTLLQWRGSPEPKSRKAFETTTPFLPCGVKKTVPQNPKAERHLRPCAENFALAGELSGSPEPKSRKAFETHLIRLEDHPLGYAGSPEPKSRKAFETTILSRKPRTSAREFPRTQKPKGI